MEPMASGSWGSHGSAPGGVASSIRFRICPIEVRAPIIVGIGRPSLLAGRDQQHSQGLGTKHSLPQSGS